MFNYNNLLSVEKNPAPRSAFEIAAAAHEHEKLRHQLQTSYELDRKVSKGKSDGDQQAYAFALLKMPLRLLTIAGQWIITL